MRFLPILCIALLKEVVGQQCANAGQKSKQCPNAKGKKIPEECCGGLDCDGQWCVDNSGGGGSGGGGTGPCESTRKISCITWATTGGRGQHLHAIVAVQDGDGKPVGGVPVTMDLSRVLESGDVDVYMKGKIATTYESSSSILKSYPTLAGQCRDPTVVNNVAYGITPAQCANKATPGNYTITVTEIDGCANFDKANGFFTKSIDYDGPTTRKLRQG